MGYHDGADIPNYWRYAHNFVLQDHMFESNASWSLPAHLYMVSGWSAYCSQQRRSDELPQRSADPGSPPDFLRTARQSGSAADAQLRLDRPHLPAHKHRT